MGKETNFDAEVLIEEAMMHSRRYAHGQILMSNPYSDMLILAPDERQICVRGIKHECRICRTLYQIASFFRTFAILCILGVLEVEVAFRESSVLGGAIAVITLALFLIYDVKVGPLVLQKTLGGNDSQKQQKVTHVHNRRAKVLLTHSTKLWTAFCMTTAFYLLSFCIMLTIASGSFCGFALYSSVAMRVADALTFANVLRLSMATVIFVLLIEVPYQATRVGLVIKQQLADVAEAILWKAEE